MRVRDDRPVPPHLRHRIEPAGPRWRLVTHWGHVLTEAATRDDVQAYYARHCCA